MYYHSEILAPSEPFFFFLFKKMCLFVIFPGCVMKTSEKKFACVVSKYLLYFLALGKKSNYLIKKYLSISYFLSKTLRHL